MDTPVHELTAWYRRHRRRLPWRESADPYAIWISETMLQQTRVDTVVPYYQAFLEAFPTVHHLAAADEAQVLKLWQGLGYYSRARNLHRAARELVNRYGGRFPDSAKAFQALPGVGPYTAGAVYSIAFGQPVPAVDGNVQRVMARYLGIREEVQTAAARRLIHEAVAQWLRQAPPPEVTQAIMELGSLVCTPQIWRCDACPLEAGCVARREGLQAELPVRRRRPDRKVIDVLALWLERAGRTLLVQRPAEGLLAGLWQLPAVERERRGAAPSDEDLVHWAVQAFAALGTREFHVVARIRHEFTHRVWEVAVVRPVGGVPQAVREASPAESFGGPYADAAWATPEELSRFTLPRVYEKLLGAMMGV